MTGETKFGVHVRPGPQGSWLSVIVKHVGDKLTVVQVGVEMDPADATKWGVDAIAMIRASGDDKAHNPDFMERNGHRTIVIASTIQ